MKKKNIILCLLILLPLCIAVGVSTWIILNENKIKTDYKGTDVINKYYDSIQEITYDGDPHYPTLDKLLNFDKVDTSNFKFAYKLTSQPDTTTLIELKDGLINAGEYDIYVRDEVIPTAEANNYDAVIHLSIKKAKLQVIAYDNQITYGDQPQANGVKYVGFVKNENSDVLSGSLSYEYNYSIYGNVGDYTITPKGLSSDNYEITFVSGKLKVNPKSLIFIWSSENPIAKIYDKTHYYPKYNLEGIVNNDAVYADLNINAISGTLVEKYAINKGEYEYSFNKLIGDKCNNYVISNSPENAKLVINPKTITIQWIDSTLTYNGNEQNPNYNISGIIDDDNLNILLSGLGIDAGNYECTITINNDNYTFDESSSLSFQYQINKATTVINTEWVPKTFKIVDGEDPIKINGATINHSEGIITYNPEYYPTETGPHDIVISVAETKNYLASSTTITVTITKKPKLILTASDLTYVYTGKEITASDLRLKATLNGTNYTNFKAVFKYKLENETEYSKVGLPKNANRYKILIYVEETDLYFASDEIEVSCIINKATPSFTVPIFNSYNTIEGFIPTIKTDETHSVPGTISSNIETALIYGVESTDNKKVSVTYTFTPTDTDNYNTVSENIEFTLYAVAKREASYYGTVEKAINATSSDKNIWVIADVYDKTKLYPIVKSDITINSDVKLILTNNKNDYSTGYKIFNEGKAVASEATGTPPIGAVLYIDDGVTITTYGTIIIGAYVNYNSRVNSHGVLMNNGTINLESGSNLYAYGYLKGNNNGVVNSNEGSKVWDLFRIYDFPRARYAAGMYYKKYDESYNNILPFNCYSFHNISCEINIYKGASYSARYQLNISDKIYPGEIEMFGDSGLFKLTTDKGYVNRKIVDTTTNTNVNSKIDSSNQDVTQKEIYNTYSNIEDNSISISFKISASVGSLNIASVNFNIATSTDLAMPIGFMELHFNGNYNITLMSNSYKFLPGSKMYISNGTTLTIKNGSNLIFYDEYYDDYTVIDKDGNIDSNWGSYYYKQHSAIYNGKNVKSDYKSKIIVDGKLICDSTGYIGGIIETTNSTGVLQLNNNNASLKRLSSIKYLDDGTAVQCGAGHPDLGGTVYTDTVHSSGLQYSGLSIEDKEFKVGTYKSYNGVWYSDEENVTINLYDEENNLLDSKTIQRGSSLEGLDFISNTNSNLHRNYYDVDCAYIDNNYVNIFALKSKIFDNVSLYIKWKPINYDIDVEDIYHEGFDAGNSSTNSNTKTFNIETYMSLTDPTNKDYVFGGWYTDSSCTNKITMLEGTTLITLLNSENRVTIYALWYPKGTNKYLIKFINENESISITNSDTIIANSDYDWKTYTLLSDLTDQLSIFNNDITQSKYFIGWYKNDELITAIDNTLFEKIDDTFTLTLTAKWKDKLEVNLIETEGFKYQHILKFYVQLNELNEFTFSSYGAKIADTLVTADELRSYTFNGYMLNGNSTTLYQENTKISINEAVISITPSITTTKYYKVNIRDSDGLMTINSVTNSKTVDNQYFVTKGSTFNVKVRGKWGIFSYWKTKITASGTTLSGTTEGDNQSSTTIEFTIGDVSSAITITATKS